MLLEYFRVLNLAGCGNRRYNAGTNSRFRERNGFEIQCVLGRLGGRNCKGYLIMSCVRVQANGAVHRQSK